MISRRRRLVKTESRRRYKGSEPAPPPAEADYYATTSGSALNDGLTEGNAWSLAHAFATAVAGDTVYVKAGDYGSLLLTSSNAGTAQAPIKFIGYTSTIGDITVVDVYGSYTYANFITDLTVLPSNIMPILNYDRGADDNPMNTTGLRINHSYVEVHNFMSQYHGVDYRVTAPNVTMINCYSNETGNWDPTNSGWGTSFSGGCDFDIPANGGNLCGYGWYVTGSADNFTLKSSKVFNAGADAIFIVNTEYHLGEYNEVFTNKKGNTSDYLYVLYGANYATLNYCKAFRYRDYDDNSLLPHRSRGIGVKHGTHHATINDFYCYGTRASFYQEVNDNIINRLSIEMEDPGESFTGDIFLSTNSNRNIFTDCTIINGTINFGDTPAEGYTSQTTGSDNYFINLVLENNTGSNYSDAFINMSNNLWTTKMNPMTDAGTNYFINCSFNNSKAMFTQDRPVIEFIFKNCAFTNVSTEYKEDNTTSPEQGGTFTYVNCNFHNTNFTTPSGTNITTHDPLFVNEIGLDFKLSDSSLLIGAGVDTSSDHANAGTDFLGISRPQGTNYDIGAYENTTNP